MGRDIGLERGASEGDGRFESSSVELEEKREPKRVALLVEETSESIIRTDNRRKVRATEVV